MIKAKPRARAVRIISELDFKFSQAEIKLVQNYRACNEQGQMALGLTAQYYANSDGLKREKPKLRLVRLALPQNAATHDSEVTAESTA